MLRIEQPRGTFKNYIFSYGRSAIVLEPKELQDSIIESLIEKKKLYIEFPFDE